MTYYVARDMDGLLKLFCEYPTRSESFEGSWIGRSILIDQSLFPELTWEDLPIKVVLNINLYVEEINQEPIKEGEHHVEETPQEQENFNSGSEENVHQEE